MRKPKSERFRSEKELWENLSLKNSGQRKTYQKNISLTESGDRRTYQKKNQSERLKSEKVISEKKKHTSI